MLVFRAKYPELHMCLKNQIHLTLIVYIMEGDGDHQQIAVNFYGNFDVLYNKRLLAHFEVKQAKRLKCQRFSNC